MKPEDHVQSPVHGSVNFRIASSELGVGALFPWLDNGGLSKGSLSHEKGTDQRVLGAVQKFAPLSHRTGRGAGLAVLEEGVGAEQQAHSGHLVTDSFLMKKFADGVLHVAALARAKAKGARARM